MSHQELFAGSWAEQDPRWTAVDAYANEHLNHHKHLDVALTRSVEMGLPNIAAYPAYAKMLALHCLAGNVTHALEIGTLGGYTSTWLTTLNPKMKLTTVEVDEMHAKVARENIDAAGVGDRVEIIRGAAIDVLEGLKADIQSGKREKFGFVFIDADKQNNWNYLKAAMELVKPGTLFVVDNIVRRGKLAVPPEQEEDEDERECVEGARDCVENVGKDPRLEAVVVQSVSEKSYDGWLFIVCK